MKIVKKIDASNRVVIPTAIRDILGIASGDEVEFIIDGGRVVITKATAAEEKSRKQIAADVLRQFGYAVPPELLS